MNYLSSKGFKIVNVDQENNTSGPRALAARIY